jgi:hypothetical protein
VLRAASCSFFSLLKHFATTETIKMEGTRVPYFPTKRLNQQHLQVGHVAKRNWAHTKKSGNAGVLQVHEFYFYGPLHFSSKQ